MGVILKLSKEQLRNDEPDIDIVTMHYLRKIEKGLNDANDQQPGIPSEADGRLPIIDFSELDKSLKSLGIMIRDYTFWATYLHIVRKKLNLGLVFLLLAGPLFAIDHNDPALSQPVFEITFLTLTRGVSISLLLSLIGLLLVVPLVYALIWTFLKQNILEDELVEARTQKKEVTEDEKSR